MFISRNKIYLFCFVLSETGSLYVVQTGLKLIVERWLTISILNLLDAGVTGESYHTQLKLVVLKSDLVNY